ncbi:MAG: acylneuraminate cytidylyltransferase family protein [Bacteroidetes bacterium]|nr:acylneuraminate cytidylyltransferase family protein [Bacteroidota bacterium]
MNTDEKQDNSYNVLAIIPARGGSKGVPGKNIRLIADEPLIAYSIHAAFQSKLLTSFAVSTDDDNIAEVSERYNAEVIKRPFELAADDSPIVPVLVHALGQVENKTGLEFEIVLVLQPTAPIRTGADIDNVINMLQADLEIGSIVSVCPIDDCHPARMYSLDSDSIMKPFDKKLETARRQELPELFHRNGAIYAMRRNTLLEQKTVMSDHKKAYIMPRSHFCNIDDERDMLIADLLVKLWKEKRL